MENLIVVGSGIGGLGAARLLHRERPLVLEKEPNLGGSAGSFTRHKNSYNAGAATFIYNPAVRRFFAKTGCELPYSKRIDPAMTVFYGEREIRRYQSVEMFVSELNKHFYHPKNYEFWRLIYRLNELFFQMPTPYYSNVSLGDKIKSVFSLSTYAIRFHRYLFTNAYGFIERFFGEIEKPYKNFLDNQIFIAAQTKSDQTTFYVAALALGYTFFENIYPFGGMQSFFSSLAQNINLKTGVDITRIEKTKEGFLLNETYHTKNLILNTPINESAGLFLEQGIAEYAKKQERFETVSAFVMYGDVSSNEKLDHHYQFIFDEVIPYSISNSFFLSISDEEDISMEKEGKRSVTVSVHTKKELWEGESYREQKEELEQFFIKEIQKRLNLTFHRRFSATPKTFGYYIKRRSLGGIPLTTQNLLRLRYPSQKTPFKGLFFIGDTTFPGPGWPGVLTGANVLEKVYGENKNT